MNYCQKAAPLYEAAIFKKSQAQGAKSARAAWAMKRIGA